MLSLGAGGPAGAFTFLVALGFAGGGPASVIGMGFFGGGLVRSATFLTGFLAFFTTLLTIFVLAGLPFALGFVFSGEEAWLSLSASLSDSSVIESAGLGGGFFLGAGFLAGFLAAGFLVSTSASLSVSVSAGLVAGFFFRAGFLVVFLAVGFLVLLLVATISSLSLNLPE